jgi:hypothetical protein
MGELKKKEGAKNYLEGECKAIGRKGKKDF